MSEKNVLPQYVELPQAEANKVESEKPKFHKFVILGVAAVVFINILGGMHLATSCGNSLQRQDIPPPPPGRFHHGGHHGRPGHMAGKEEVDSGSESDSDDEDNHSWKPQHHSRPKGVKFQGDEVEVINDRPHEGRPEGRPHPKGKGKHHKGDGPRDRHRSKNHDDIVVDDEESDHRGPYKGKKHHKGGRRPEHHASKHEGKSETPESAANDEESSQGPEPKGNEGLNTLVVEVINAVEDSSALSA